MNNLIDILKIVGILAVLLGPAIARGYKAMQEQAAKREAELRRRKAQEDALRTGRFEAPPAPTVAAQPTVSVSPASAEMDAKRRLQELARQRRAELEQLAGGGTAQAGSGGGTPVGGSGGGSAGTPGRTIGAPGPQPMYKPKPNQQPRPASRFPGQGQAGQGKQRAGKASAKPARGTSQSPSRGSAQPTPMPRQPQASRPNPAAQQAARAEANFYDAAPGGHQHSSADEGESIVHRLVGDTAGEQSTLDQGATSMATVRLAQALGAGGLRAKGVGGQTSAAAIAELRRAIVLREVFDPPVGLRNPADADQGERRIA